MQTHLAATLAFILLLAGCGGGDAQMARTAPAVTAPTSDDTTEAGIVAFHARTLAVEVGLSAEGEARVAAILARAWSAAQDDVQGRIDAALPVDEEVVSELLLARQREADRAIAALLTPAQRARFEEFGGRLQVEDDEELAVIEGGAR